MAVAHRIEEMRIELSALAESLPSAQELMRSMTKMLHKRMLKYNWVGFYMLEPGAQPPMLVLGAFEGAVTPHTRIPLNQGICGAAASSGQTVVVDDVSKDPRYLGLFARNQIGDCRARCLCTAKWWASWISTATSLRLYVRTSGTGAALRHAHRQETGNLGQ
jgi:hypothetical protein